jgi:transposase
MVAIPTLEEEDAKRPNREHDTLVRQRTRIINRIKSGLVRFGIQNFKPTLRKSAERLGKLMTPEGIFRLPTKMRPTPGPSNLTIRESYESLIAVY